MELVAVAHRPGHPHLDGDAHLPGDWLADLPGDLEGVVDGPLLALPLCAGVALGSAGMQVASLRLPLAVVDLGVAADHSRGVLDMLGNMVALLRHDILAVLHVGGLHHGVVLGESYVVVHTCWPWL